ncbi:MAG: phage Gp37/Gp68 family protein [Dehalococcoidia bacterium]|nr:phage Gp37/Gp68 family protein [Dehalococcoidia bacterium]
MARSTIEWTESTWNPLTGCTKISPGCKHCYAERMARRLQAMGQPNYVNAFELTLHEDALEMPLHWKRPQRIFVNSMSDLFHEDVPDAFILRAFDVMRRASWHQFQVLTKRSDRLLEISPHLPWPGNIWMGVTVENAEYAYRIDHLRMVDAAVRFLSLEPLIGAMPEMALSGIDWVIVGGESGPGARPMEADWARDAQRQCRRVDVPFFFKQWGGRNKKKAGRLLDGTVYDGMPAQAYSRRSEVAIG